MKKLITLFAASLLTFAFAGAAEAAEGKIIDGRTLVPVRGAFEELGFTVDWDADTATATISDQQHVVDIVKGETFFIADGNVIEPDVPQQIIDGRFYLPLRAIGDSVGADISWDGETKTAHISYLGMDSYINCLPDEYIIEAPDVYNDSIYGAYSAEVDITPYVMEQSGFKGDYSGSMYVCFDLYLNENGTATLSCDSAATDASIRGFFNDNITNIISESLGRPVTNAELAEVCQYLGVANKEELVDMIFEEVGLSDALQFSESGSFTVNGNVINLDGDMGTIENGVITFTNLASKYDDFGNLNVNTLVFMK